MSATAALMKIATGGMPIDAGVKLMRYYIQITLTNTPNNYPANGDTIDLTNITFPPGMNGMITSGNVLFGSPQSQPTSSSSHSGFMYAYLIGTGTTPLKNGKIQVLVCAGAGNPMQDLGAGNYPAGVLSDTIVMEVVVPGV
jgi:hypothetical protein